MEAEDLAPTTSLGLVEAQIFAYAGTESPNLPGLRWQMIYEGRHLMEIWQKKKKSK